MKIVVVLVAIITGSLIFANAGSNKIKITMNQMAVIFTQMLELIDKGSSKSNTESLKGLSFKLLELAKQVNTKNRHDPIFNLHSSRLVADFNTTNTLFEAGRVEEAKVTFRRSLSLCIECHTRSPKGAYFLNFIKPTSFSTWPSKRKADFLVATRQFPLALVEYETALREGRSLSEADKTDIIRKIIVLTTRVKRSPHLTLEMTTVLTKIAYTPKKMLGSIKMWREGAKEWIKSLDNPIKDSKRRFEQARTFFEKGKTKNKVIISGGLVEFLYAEAALRKILVNKSDKFYGVSLLYMGLVSSQLVDLGFWESPSYYWLTCIYAKPNSITSEACYRKLYEREELRWPKNKMPARITKELSDLKKMAKP